MYRTITSIIKLLITITLFNLVSSCKAPVVSTISQKNITTPITASIDIVNVVDDKVNVEILLNPIDLDTLVYFMPKIVPGTYQNNDYGQYIDDFKAFDLDGNLLSVERKGKNQWRIGNPRKLQKITYWVNDTFDSEEEHTIFSPTGSNILKDKNFILNLYAFIGYFDGMQENEYRLFIKHPSILEASTAKEKTHFEHLINTTEYEIDHFVFNRYADVVDHPIMYSRPNKVTFSINGIEVLLSIYSNNPLHKSSKIMSDMERMMRAQKNFLGSSDATKKYSIILYLSSSKSDDAKGFGALEHNTSTVVVLPESLSRQKLIKTLTDVVSHEFFHIVTPLTLHSKEIHYFDYNAPKMSEHLWLYEGTTEYFSILFQITQGLISKEEFFERIIGKINASQQFDDTMSFTTMSKNILFEPYKKNYRNVYEKGALISMCIDILMREKSRGQKGILDLIKSLSTTFGVHVPFEDKQLLQAIEKVSYPEIRSFLQKHVVEGTPIDYAFYLKKVGVKYGIKNIPSSYFIFEQQPFVKGIEASQEVTFSSDIPFNNFLKDLGIIQGDVLISINKKKYNIKNIYHLFGDSNKWRIGDEVVFNIKRNDQIKKLRSTVIKPTVEKIILKQDPNASAFQKSLLESWINE
ncbi:M61 family metallopeptidase [Aquimarina pacifica]|uniref:M61 family metallopeptidase n=1 Tax=Aquimarina pacifica TaxID=1296415 RepID=UPI0004B26612|nr:peptidase M61 [Aquimarina pacifica]